MAAHRAPHVAAFGAAGEGNLVGSNFATKWGGTSVFFGPIIVRPDLQESGIAQALLARTMEQFDASANAACRAVPPFRRSTKHIVLYQKYQFYAHFLTAISADAQLAAAHRTAAGWSRFPAT